MVIANPPTPTSEFHFIHGPSPVKSQRGAQTTPANPDVPARFEVTSSRLSRRVPFSDAAVPISDRLGKRLRDPLILDEPTNHLDVENMEALEDYEGSVLLVSHDRAFLREVATRVWACEGTRIVDFDGPFVEWEEERARRVRSRSARRVPLRTYARRDLE